MREVVTNTSPLLYLHQLGSIDLRRRALLEGTRTQERRRRTGCRQGWRPRHSQCSSALLGGGRVIANARFAGATDLGKGEAEAIAIAHERNALLILDDALARRHANLIGVTVTGTLGILLKAKADGHIPRISPLVTRMAELGFRLSAQTRDAVLNLANES